MSKVKREGEGRRGRLRWNGDDRRVNKRSLTKKEE